MSFPVTARRYLAVLRNQLSENLAELLAYAACYVALVAVMVATDALDSFYAYSRAHEGWELDEIVLATVALGFTGFAFVVRRWRMEYKDKQRIQVLTEELQQALQAAHAADDAKAAFLATLSHELRTPINAISGYAQIMEGGLMGPIDARYAGYARNIRESGEHLLGLINNILEVTRAASGSIRLQRETVDLHALTRQCFMLMSVRAAEEGIDLVNRVPADFPAVSADSQRLGQVLINLVGNAVKFSPPGSAVTVSAAVRGGDLRIEVRDRGIGMTPEDAERALQPFVQIDNPLKKRREGAGIGLALVKRFVELHGGSLKLDSAPGRGTTAIVTLPDAVAPASGQQGAAE